MNTTMRTQSTVFDRAVDELVQIINASNNLQDVRSIIKDTANTFVADNKQALHSYIKRELARNHKSTNGFWCNNASGSATIYGTNNLKYKDFRVRYPRLRFENMYGEHGPYDPKCKQNIGSHIEDKLISITQSLLDKYFHDIDNQVFKFVEQNIVPKIESDLNKLFTESNLLQSFMDDDISSISSQCKLSINTNDMKKLITDYLHQHYPNIQYPPRYDSTKQGSAKSFNIQDIEFPKTNILKDITKQSSAKPLRTVLFNPNIVDVDYNVSLA